KSFVHHNDLARFGRIRCRNTAALDDRNTHGVEEGLAGRLPARPSSLARGQVVVGKSKTSRRTSVVEMRVVHDRGALNSGQGGHGRLGTLMKIDKAAVVIAGGRGIEGEDDELPVVETGLDMAQVEQAFPAESGPDE